CAQCSSVCDTSLVYLVFSARCVSLCVCVCVCVCHCSPLESACSEILPVFCRRLTETMRRPSGDFDLEARLAGVVVWWGVWWGGCVCVCVCVSCGCVCACLHSAVALCDFL